MPFILRNIFATQDNDLDKKYPDRVQPKIVIIPSLPSISEGRSAPLIKEYHLLLYHRHPYHLEAYHPR
jgi:hypothetical protein